MFGCIVAGRLVQTNLQQVDVNKYVFELSDAQSINHLVVFLLGTIPFQQGFGATVHLLWPNKEWQLLGVLLNEKPSAIFRLRQNNNAATTTPQVSTPATLGISIEPIDIIQQQVETQGSASMMDTPGDGTQMAIVKPPPTTPNLNQAGQLASKILDNLYNYVTSFVQQDLPLDAIPLSTLSDRGYLPLKAFQTWYENLSRKLGNDPNYLTSDKSG
ncbi:hypothetical protein BDB00DRAFT_873389 [Zychaea mexicana]|uniref:uncharacterized protein n=1 Tax=Zychaea mexicana TaxID=64656 RepID=UPI0022FED3E3|nr:uncharacterized protein BDB00DRAFT_873389 [Zychaea mexicana]KAI9492469.1 hypothetical protein BDB00DRAFT_873389 [Zychaea mexicana]